MIRVIDVLSGNEIDLTLYDLTCLSFIPESLSPQFQEEEIEGADGTTIIDTKITKRMLYTKFVFEAVDHLDYQLLRDEIYKIFDPRKDLFIIDTRQPGKRWKARVSSGFRPDYQNSVTGAFDLEFISPKPYAESVGTTLDPFTFDSELWQFGQGLIAEDLIYKHNVNSFSIYNAGDEEVNPEKFPLIIKYKGASTNLEIENTTTGDVWNYTGTSIGTDTIELNGVKAFKNGTSIFGDTNWAVIKLTPGWNEFILTGTNGSFEISFDFRFYYV